MTCQEERAISFDTCIILLKHTLTKYFILHNINHSEKTYLEPTAPSPESWLPASLGVLTDFEDGDIGGGTK